MLLFAGCEGWEDVCAERKGLLSATGDAYFDIFERTMIMESKNMIIPETMITTYCVSKSVP
jgi:hypothetical protein